MYDGEIHQIPIKGANNYRIIDFKDYQISESANDTPELQGILDEAIDNVLNKKSYETIAKPTDNKLGYINSLNNAELARDIQEEFRTKSKEYLQQRAKEDALKNSQEIYDALPSVKNNPEASEDIETELTLTDDEVTQLTSKIYALRFKLING